MTKSIWTCFALAFTLLMFTSCGGSSTPTAPTAPTAGAFIVTEAPNPIIATAGSQGFHFTATFSLTVREAAGLGGNVNVVNVTLRNATNGLELNTINFSATDIFNRAGTNHIAALATLNINGLGELYTLGGGGRQATMTVQIGDDAGHIVNQVLTVPIV